MKNTNIVLNNFFIGQNMKEKMNEEGFTVKSFAKEIGVEENAIYNYFSGRNVPSMKNACAIALTLGISLDDLIKFELKEM